MFVEASIGNTPLVELQRIPGAVGRQRNNRFFAKLEGNNPAGSVKDRPALSMIHYAQERGEIKPGDTLVEATSGNTGIALAMVAAMRGYKMVLVMPENQSLERRQTMRAYGAELILTPTAKGIEFSRDHAVEIARERGGRVLDQFANPDNPRAHFEGTGPEIWRQTEGKITHFIATMGTTGTITGTSQYLKQQRDGVQIIGVHPAEGASVPGIRKWPEAYKPVISKAARIDRVMEVTQKEAEDMARRLAAEEGIFCGISSGGGLAAAMRLNDEVENAVIVHIVCDRGDRYLSTGVFEA
jgi:S-sulfo-L-cysteine synthase (O-acetyl-L-serine-dependent)